MNFSLIIPLYNSNYIDTQIKSILNLKLNWFFLEVIFVDDGSDVFYQEKYKKTLINVDNKNIEFKIKILWNKNWKNRVCEARNKWASLAKYKNLIFIDQETILSCNYLINLKKSLKNNNVIIWPYFWYNNLKKSFNKEDVNFFIKNWFLNKENFQDFRINFYKEKQKNWRIWEFFAASNFFIKKDIFEKVWWFDEKIITWWDEDVEFWYRLYKSWYKIIFDNTIWVLNLSEKLYKSPFKILELSKIESLSNNWLINYKKHNNYEYKRYILDRFNNFDNEEKPKVSLDFKSKFLNKKNILIHAMNGIWIGHIKRTLILAKKLRELDEIWEIIFTTNSSNPFLIRNEWFKIEKLDYWIEDTLQWTRFSTYENENFLKINKIIQDNDINIVIHDTYFIKKLVNERLDLIHFLILRDSELSYLETIIDFLPRFRKIFVPHIKQELSQSKLQFYSKFKNIFFIWYILEKNKIKIKKKKRLIISPGYWWDYQNTFNFLKYINDLLYFNREIIKDYEVEFILWKHNKLLKEKINFSNEYKLFKFKKNLSEEIGDCNLFIWRWWYNTVNEVFFNEINSLLFSVDRFGENQDTRIDFFIKNFSLDFIKKWVYNIKNDSINLKKLLLSDFKKNIKNEEIFNWIENFINLFEKEINKANILVFKHIFLPLSENFIFEELSSLKEINPIIFTFKKDNVDFFINSFQLINKFKFEDLLALDYPKIWNNKLYIEYLQYVLFLIRKYSIKIIYTEFLFDAFFICKIKTIHPDIKIISAWRWYDVYAFLKKNYVDKIGFLNKLDKVLVRDFTMKKELMNYWLKSNKLEVVRSVLDFSKYNFRKKDFSKLNILFWWRFTEKKQLLKLLDLIKLLNDKNLIWDVWLVWDWELKDKIIKKIDFLWLKSKIKMYWFLKHKNLFEVLDDYNCFISYSSKSENWDDEAIPNLISENILSWNIIFSTITWWLSELLKDYDTWIILSWDIKTDFLKIQEALDKINFELIVKNWFNRVRELLSPKFSSEKLENILKTI